MRVMTGGGKEYVITIKNERIFQKREASERRRKIKVDNAFFERHSHPTPLGIALAF